MTWNADSGHQYWAGRTISSAKMTEGAEDNAVFYSLLGSCDVVQVNPLQWLTDVLGKINDDMDEDYIVAHEAKCLTPCRHRFSVGST